MSTSDRRDLRSLPKAHLHLHFVGAMRSSTLYDLARRSGAAVPPVSDRYGTFADFQARYVAAVDVLQREEDLSRLVREIVEDAKVDGAVWVEPAINLANHGSIGSPSDILDLVLEAGANAAQQTGVGIGWIVEADRTLPPSVAVEYAELAATCAGRGVVGFGLANDESAAPAQFFAEAFAIARGANLLSVPHAGEFGGAESVRAAVDVLGAVRLGHGVRAIEDPALVEHLASRHVCLDLCPTSNLKLSVVPGLSSHPLPSLLASGVSCSINADDPLLFGSGLLGEYEVCREVIGLDDVSLANCARWSIELSAAPLQVRRKAFAGIRDWLAHETSGSE